MKRLTCLLFLILAAGDCRAATRVALIAGPGGPNVRTALDLATAGASALPGVELLERAGIARVLAEQKLTLAGLADAGQAITAGKLLSADVLAVIEVGSDGKAALGLVVFDAKTGLRLWDAALPEGGPVKEAAGITDGLKAALKKHAAGRDGLRTVGFVAVRNADLPHAQDSYCDSLALLIERRLVAAPAVGVLERQRLEVVTGERALPTQAAEKELLGALVQLDLEVRRGPRGEGLVATVRLTDPKGKLLGKVEAAVKDSEPGALADALTARICEAVKAAPGAEGGTPAREGTRFLTEARQLWSFKKYAHALRAAEAAYALDPKDPSKSEQLSQYLIAEGGNHLHVGIYVSPRPLAATPEAVAAAAGLVRRGIDLRSLALNNLPAKNARTLFTYVENQSELNSTLIIALTKVAAVDRRLLGMAAQRPIAEIEEAVERWVCKEYLETLAVACEREPFLFELYTSALVSRFGDLRLAAADAQNYARQIVNLMERWLEVAQKVTPVQMGESAATRPWLQLTYTTKSAGHAVRWSPGPRELEQLDGLFEKMEKHAHPLIRLQGRCGRQWVSLANGKVTPEDCYRNYLVAKREILDLIKDPRRPVPEVVVLGYFHYVNRLCISDVLGFKQSGHLLDEQFEVLESMLDRRVLAEEVVKIVTQMREPLPKPGRKLAVLDRTVALIDDPRVFYYGGDRKVMKGALNLERSNYIALHPDLAERKGPLPWESVRPVLDVADLPGIVEFRMPTVVGEDIVVVGIGGGRDRGFIQPFRVPLTGGNARPLGRMVVTWHPLPIDRGFTGIPEKITGCEVYGKFVYVSARTGGVYAFPLDGGPARRIDEGQNWPTEKVESMALYDGRLYAALDGGYLVSVDPQTGKFEVLASSRRREKASPWDDSEAFIVPYLAADPERRRLLLLVYQGRSKPGAPNGLWSWDPKSREFKRILETGGREVLLEGRQIRDGHLLLSSINTAVDVDLASGKHTLLWGFGAPCGPLLDPKKALCQESFRASGPHLYRDGWLWSEAPFGRISIAKKAHEILDPPQRKDNAASGGAEALLGVGKNQLLVCKTKVVWLFTLRKE